jgi:Family of unknown function (DUF6069)
MATPTTRPWRARVLAVIAAVLAPVAVWLVTDPLLGVDLAAPTRPRAAGQAVHPRRRSATAAMPWWMARSLRLPKPRTSCGGVVARVER